MKQKTNQEFVEELRSRLSSTGDLDNYDLSKVEYVSESHKIKISCLKHGEMEVRPNDWLNGARCNICGKDISVAKRRKPMGDIITEAKSIHGELYDYSRFDYKNNKTPGIILCKEHGEFLKAMSNHIGGKKEGCPYCSGSRRFGPPIIRVKKEDFTNLFLSRFLEKSKLLHGDKFDYSKVIYVRGKEEVIIGCPIHGDYLQTPDNHTGTKHGCPRCARESTIKAKVEVELTETPAHSSNIECNTPVLDGKHIDILIPSLSIGVEYCGLYFHSDNIKGSTTYHRDKYLMAKSKGILLIQIFEDEWLFKKDIVKNMLEIKLGKPSKGVPARKLAFKKIENEEVSEFYDKTHLQGSCPPASFNYGLFEGPTLLAAMSFSTSNVLVGQIELTRFSSIGRVQGGFSKLLSNAIPELKLSGVSVVVSFSDNRWGTGAVYERNGFENAGESEPRYWWVKGQHRFHRRLFQRKYLKDRLKVFDESLSEAENCIANGYIKIHDAGVTKWVLSI